MQRQLRHVRLRAKQLPTPKRLARRIFGQIYKQSVVVALQLAAQVARQVVVEVIRVDDALDLTIGQCQLQGCGRVVRQLVRFIHHHDIGHGKERRLAVEIQGQQ